MGMPDAKWTEFDRIQRYYLAGSRLMAPNKRREIISILGMYLQERIAVSMLRVSLVVPISNDWSSWKSWPNKRPTTRFIANDTIDDSFGSSQRSIPTVYHQVVAADHVGRRRRQEQYRVGHLDRFAEPPRRYLRLHRIAPLRISPYLHP